MKEENKNEDQKKESQKEESKKEEKTLKEENERMKKEEKKEKNQTKKMENKKVKKQSGKVSNTNWNIMKTVKILTIILIVILISMVGFAGIYKKEKGQMKNVLKEYNTSMALNGARAVKLTIKSDDSSDSSTENTENEAENTTNETSDENATDETSNETENETSTETNNTTNEEENQDKKVADYKTTKKVIEKRLKDLNVTEYTIKLNENNGDIEINIPENANTDNVISVLTEVGKFEIVDADTNDVLMTNDDIKNAKVVYSSSSSGTSVYLEILFNKDGKEKLSDISKTYVKAENTTNDTSSDANTTTENTSDESTENTANENNSSENSTNDTTDDDSTSTQSDKKITMKIDDETIMSTYFDEQINNGKLDLTIGSATTDSDKLQSNIEQGQNLAATLSNGKLEGDYEANKNEFVPSSLTQKDLIVFASIISVIACVGIVVLIVKFRLSGLLSGISFIGFAAICALILRYTNVMISLETITAAIIALILDYIFIWIFLKNVKKYVNENIDNAVSKACGKTYKKFFLDILPICFVTIVSCFVKWTPISSFGMASFWNISMIAIYNAIITYSLMYINKEKN